MADRKDRPADHPTKQCYATHRQDRPRQQELDTIPSALLSFKNGDFLVVVDNLDRENEGDLIIAAQHCTKEKLAFMIRYTSGLICVPMHADKCERLQLPPMCAQNQDLYSTAYTVSCDYKIGTTTGISAHDRAATIRALANPDISHIDFARPGHVFPLRARKEGVLKRVGHTEAAVDLCRLCDLEEVAAISEIVLDNGEMARRDDLLAFSKQWGLKMISIDDLRQYRLEMGL